MIKYITKKLLKQKYVVLKKNEEYYVFMKFSDTILYQRYTEFSFVTPYPKSFLLYSLKYGWDISAIEFTDEFKKSTMKEMIFDIKTKKLIKEIIK